MNSVKILLLVAILGLVTMTKSEAQTSRLAPIGHRQPAIKDLPTDTIQREGSISPKAKDGVIQSKRKRAGIWNKSPSVPLRSARLDLSQCGRVDPNHH
jgi:hypothetical protein